MNGRQIDSVLRQTESTGNHGWRKLPPGEFFDKGRDQVLACAAG
jgi:hypothetical protein